MQSPDWVMYPEAKAYHKDQAKSSRKQSSNTKLLEMLKRMKQGMLERDIQLKAQLEKIDQYLE